jgi:hypothetical protein
VRFERIGFEQAWQADRDHRARLARICRIIQTAVVGSCTDRAVFALVRNRPID